MTSPADKK